MNDRARTRIEEIEKIIAESLGAIDRLVDENQETVLNAFAKAQVSESDLFGSTGYGLGDRGREQLDRVFAYAFGAEAGLVRPAFASGTHALSVALFALLRPGDELLYATGTPYDTLAPVIGIRGRNMGSLAEFGVTFSCVALGAGDRMDIPAIIAAISPATTVVAIQRSAGYAWRRSLCVQEIGDAIAAIRAVHPHVRFLVDNCYGEFTETREPSAVGADLVVGSLIKNAGGGIAPTGGYIVGTQEAVAKAAYRLTAPGIGAKSGSYENYRLFFQGLFLAPHVVGQALKGNLFAAQALTEIGLTCAPEPSTQARGDIVLRIQFQSADRLVSFCQAIQCASPIDAHVRPEPWQMPGYEDPVIMAAGAFVQGSSIELSADGPLREPYIGYLQGGLTYAHVKIAILRAVDKLTSD